MARTSSTILKKVVKADTLVLFMILNETLLIFANWILTCRFHIYSFYFVEICSFYSHFADCFYHNGCCTLSNAFSASIDMIMWFFSFILFMWYITFIELWMLYHPCIPGINPTWSWCMIFLMYSWISVANILLMILALCSSEISACDFVSLLYLHLVMELGLYLPCRKSWEYYLFFNFFE